MNCLIGDGIETVAMTTMMTTVAIPNRFQAVPIQLGSVLNEIPNTQQWDPAGQERHQSCSLQKSFVRE